jgi:hypothetical protein
MAGATGSPACARNLSASSSFLWNVLCSAQAILEPATLATFTVELYTPGEIIESRRSFDAQEAGHALRFAGPWMKDGSHSASHVRVVDDQGVSVLELDASGS